MFKYLLFDDQRLLVRHNLKRQYGRCEMAGTYNDPDLTTSYGWVWVNRGVDKKVHMLYLGHEKNAPRLIPAAAVSDDGINFTPRNTAELSGVIDPVVPHQTLPPCSDGTEIAGVFTDLTAPPEERYKMLMCDFRERATKYKVNDLVYVSPDLIHWKELPESCWNQVGTEPIAGAFYNSIFNCYSILTRPDCGQRRVCLTETTDWHHFTTPELLMQCDSLDPALAEIYGMNALEYEGYFIGVPLIYNHVPQVRRQKYHGGAMSNELAYSLNGRHWQRSLRTPLIPGDHPDFIKNYGVRQNMVFPTSFLIEEDGSILIYTASTSAEHGSQVSFLRGKAHISVFRMRPDGFICLTNENPEDPALLAFREVCWQGGQVSFNLSAEWATCAVYEMVTQAAEAKLLYAHEECRPFSGDSVNWQPVWGRDQTLDKLTGKTVIFELQMRNGSVYSCSGNGVPLMDLEAERYRRTGVLSVQKGM